MICGYIALYKSSGGNKVVTKTLDYPPEVRKFKVPGGIKKFKRVSYKEARVEVFIVAKATKKSTKKKNTEVTDDELDELESVDDLEEEVDEDLEDEDVDEDEDEDEDEDDEDEDEDDEDEPDDEDDEDEDEEDEEPPKRKKGKSKPRQSRAAKEGLVGTQEIAKAAGCDARTLRMVLRKHKVAKDEESGRYQWKSLNDPTVKKILKWIKAGEADSIKKESLDKLKAKKAAEKTAKSKDAASKTTGKKKKKRSTS